MDISVEKFGVIKIGSFASHYEINGFKLKYINLVKDLGVEFDTNLDFSVHCLDISKKASTRANMLLRAFHATDLHILIKVF